MFRKLGMFDRSLGMFQPPGSIPFQPGQLFLAGEQGVWYDPSDWATLFQDSAGTTPVTAIEQPVGLMLDKSKNGVGTNGAFRYNLLAYTEQFENVYWLQANCTIGQNAIIAPNGEATADKIIESATTGNHVVYKIISNSGSYSFSIAAKAAERSIVAIQRTVSGANQIAWFDLGIGAVGTQTNCVGSISSLGGGWYRCSISGSAASTEVAIYSAISNGATSYAGDGTSGIYIWGASLTTAADASLPYQRITDTWYSTIPGNHAFQSTTTSRPILRQEAGGQYYLAFDGTDDWLQVTSFILPLIERMTAVGFQENSAVANQGCVSVYPATGNDFDSTTGYVLCPSNRTTSRFITIGSTLSSYLLTWTTSPASIIPASVIMEDKKTSAGYLRVNGTQVASDTSFTEFAVNSNGGLLLGARWTAGAISSSGRLNGRIYSVIIRGASTPLSVIQQTERWIAAKIGVTL